ncbi:MAG: hypothetical protein AAGJ40_14300, partial [Planctomycetota bacterium]
EADAIQITFSRLSIPPNPCTTHTHTGVLLHAALIRDGTNLASCCTGRLDAPCLAHAELLTHSNSPVTMG